MLLRYLPAFESCDADDLLSQIRTWRHADAARAAHGGGLAAALRRVSAKVRPMHLPDLIISRRCRLSAPAFLERP